MKKILFFLITLFAIATFTHAQDVHVGAKAGANLGKIDGQSFDDGFKLSYQLGAYVEIPVSKKIDIRPELLFNQTKTTVTDQTSAIFKPGDDITLNYLSIPVLLQINSTKLLNFQLGPQFSILMNNHKTVAGNAVDAFKSGDFSVLAGAQVNLGAWNVYGRYVIGLSNISDLDNRGDWKSQQIQLGLGLRIL